MKKPVKIILCILAALILLAAAVIGVLYFAFDIDIFDRSGWKQEEDGSRYYLDYQGDPLTGWQEIDGKRHYFDPESGRLLSGWLKLDGHTYCLDSDGVMITGWMEGYAYDEDSPVENARYYFGEDGILRTHWLDTADGRYYLGDNGVMVTGWQKIDGGTYFFADDGLMTAGWLETAEGTYYFSNDGLMTTGWLGTAEGEYHFGQDGIMTVGWLETAEGTYFFADNGIMATGWLETAEGKYYLGSGGIMVTGWQEIEGLRYLFDSTGTLVAGWRDTDEGRYYFDENGLIATGWVNAEDGRYYLNADGHPYTGWLNTDEARYYFTGDGKMATGFLEVDGIMRYFTSDGNYVPLVNYWNEVPQDYVLNLVDLEGYKIDSTCRDQLKAMVEACREAGLTCELNSTYRSVNTQWYLWNRRLNAYKEEGYDDDTAHALTRRRVAYPGTSEHHTGLAVDITGTNAMYDWLHMHCWEYGFIARYLNGKESETGIMYEPWHFRYVGVEMAKAIYDSGLCLEEYLESIGG